jgi:catechol 2,3-dioxygenase-like lactoylglutathione lyase family enzyme
MRSFDIALDHIQLAAPPDCERAAREFYSDILGFDELEKPEPLRRRGGCWFCCGSHQVHIGVEENFRPAKKAHPAFSLSNLAALRTKLLERGYEVIDDADLVGVRRFYTSDPWGNRIEFVEAGAGRKG